MQDHGETDRQDRVTGDARQRRKPGRQHADRGEALEPFGRRNRSSLGFLQQTVQLRDLVEPVCARQRCRELERGRPPIAERDHERGRKRVDLGRHTVGARDPAETFLHRVHGLVDGVHCGSELHHENLELAQVDVDVFHRVESRATLGEGAITPPR